MRKCAVYTGSANLYPMMVPAVKSLLKWSSVDDVYLLIEDDKFPYELPERVHAVDVSGQTYFDPDGPNMGSHFTYLAMIRAALCHVFPDMDSILSLDVDTVCVDDVDGVWDIDLDGCYFAASIEPDRSKWGLEYCNTGVALYNLKLLRESGKADEVIEVLNRHRFTFVEQDAFSYLCQGHIAQMPAMYNSNPYVISHDEKRIIHYAGQRDWVSNPGYVAAERMTWDEVLS